MLLLEGLLLFMGIALIAVGLTVTGMAWGMQIPDDKMHIHKRNVCRYYAKENKKDSWF